MRLCGSIFCVRRSNSRKSAYLAMGLGDHPIISPGRVPNAKCEGSLMNGIAQAIRDAIDVQAELPEPGAASGTRVLAASTVGSSLVFLSGSVISVALPAIRSGLHFSAADVQWTLNAELLPLAAVSMAGGALGDRYGRRN